MSRRSGTALSARVRLRGAATGTLAAAALLLAACADRPPTPDWQLNAKSGSERALAAYFDGNARVEAQEYEGMRSAIARTGRRALLARAELVRCAGRIASLVLEPCSAFDALAADAGPAERAYAAFLAGRATPQDAPLLPEAQRAVAAATTAEAGLAALERMTDPLSKLVGAAVLLQTAHTSPALTALAVDTASAQGWRRPLLAWLQLQLRQTEAAGDAAATERIRRRIDMVAGVPEALR